MSRSTAPHSSRTRISWKPLLRHPGFLAAAGFALAALLIGIDRTSTSAFHDYMRPYDPWLQLLTYLGDGRVLLPACGFASLLLVALRHRARWAPLAAAACVISSGLVTNILKMMIGRPRPYTDTDARYLAMPAETFHWFTVNHDFESFPSGHSTAIFALAWFVSLRVKDTRAKAMAITLGVIVALTRVALYKHYFADTLAGAAVGIGITELVTTLFGLAGKPPVLKLSRKAMFLLPCLLTSCVLLQSCSSVKSRIHDHEGEFASYPPQTQAQIQNGRIDKGFTEEMVFLALGEPSDKSTETSSGSRSGKTVVVWKYPKPASLLNTTAAPNTLSAPYGYPGPATGPAQTAPMFYERSYYKVKFENGKVVEWDEELQR